MTTSQLENELDLCEFFETCNPDDENQIEGFCVFNYENCLDYRKYKTEIEKKRYNKDNGGKRG